MNARPIWLLCHRGWLHIALGSVECGRANPHPVGAVPSVAVVHHELTVVDHGEVEQREKRAEALCLFNALLWSRAVTVVVLVCLSVCCGF